MATSVEKIEQIGKLMANEDFIKKLVELDDTDAAIALFAENGLTVTAEELQTFGTLFKSLEDNDGEIPDEVAEMIAGGAGGADDEDTGGLLDGPIDLMDIIKELLKGVKSPLNKVFKLFGVTNVKL